jgi:hypothetical protein
MKIGDAFRGAAKRLSFRASYRITVSRPSVVTSGIGEERQAAGLRRIVFRIPLEEQQSRIGGLVSHLQFWEKTFAPATSRSTRDKRLHVGNDEAASLAEIAAFAATVCGWPANARNDLLAARHSHWRWRCGRGLGCADRRGRSCRDDQHSFTLRRRSVAASLWTSCANMQQENKGISVSERSLVHRPVILGC